MSGRKANSRGKSAPQHLDSKAEAEAKETQQKEAEEAAERKEEQGDSEESSSKMTDNQRRVQFSAAVVKQIVHPHMGSVLAKEPTLGQIPEARLQSLREEYERWVEEHNQEQKDGDMAEGKSGDDGEEKQAEVAQEPTFELQPLDVVQIFKAIGHDQCADSIVERAVTTTMGQLAMRCVTSPEDLQQIYERFYAPANTHGEQLRRACGRGDLMLAQELIARGCDVACCNGLMMTPLHYCAEYDQVEAAELVLSFDGSVSSEQLINAKDRYGWTALTTAVNHGCAAVVSLLLRQGADVNATNKQGRTALHVAAARNHVEMSERLLQAGADVNAVDANNMTPAHVAAMSGNINVYTLLTAVPEFDIDKTDNLEHTAKDYLAITAA